MAIIKPSIPKGTRDFSPVEMVRRNYIFDTISSVFYQVSAGHIILLFFWDNRQEPII